MLGILLEGSFGPGGAIESFGLLAFALACIAFILCPLFFIVAAIVAALRKQDDPDTKKHKIFVKLGLISLVFCGICLLLSAVLCTSH